MSEEFFQRPPKVNQKREKDPRGRKKEEFYISDKGIEAKPIEKFVRFGTLLLNKVALNRNNKLSVRYPSLGGIRDLPTTMVSDDFCDCLKYVLEHSVVNQKMLNKLSNKEKVLFFNICKRAKIDDQLGLTNYKDDELESDMNRFELLKGMILAGNNAPEILKEIRTLILKFMCTGQMSKQHGNQLLLEINSIM